MWAAGRQAGGMMGLSGMCSVAPSPARSVPLFTLVSTCVLSCPLLSTILPCACCCSLLPPFCLVSALWNGVCALLQSPIGCGWWGLHASAPLGGCWVVGVGAPAFAPCTPDGMPLLLGSDVGGDEGPSACPRQLMSVVWVGGFLFSFRSDSPREFDTHTHCKVSLIIREYLVDYVQP